MNKYLLALALLAVLPATHANTSQFKVTGPYGKTALGRCHMGYCSWGTVLNKKVITKSTNSMTVEASIRGGESPMSHTEKVTWNKKPHKLVAVCSKQNPALLNGDEINQLNVKDFSAVEESSVNMYFLICHDYENGAYDGAKKFKY